MAEKYIISPIEHLLSLDKPSLHMFSGAADWPSKNLTIEQKRMRKRWGYLEDRDVEENVQGIWIYQQNDGTRNTLYLTDTNLIRRETAPLTWSYKTEEYATGNVSDISGVTVTGSGTTWVTAMVGDYFVLDEDLSDTAEPDASWRKISAASTTSLTLSAAYQKDISSTSKAYHIRRVYSTPSNQRWQVAVVDDKFCFTNDIVNVQYWGGGSTYASALDSTYATRAKYCIEYGNRLCLANLYIGGTASPWTLRASANGDPTKWSTEDTSAVDYEFIETDDVISGLGKVGAGLVVYKTESLIFGQKTAKATDPFIFLSQKRGVGCVAPYSIVEYRGTNAFLGRDDFYKIDGDHPVPIGERIRYKFKEIVSDSERENVWGFNNFLDNEILWFANTSEGPWVFVYDYKDEEWGAYWFADFMSGAGRGAV